MATRTYSANESTASLANSLRWSALLLHLDDGDGSTDHADRQPDFPMYTRAQLGAVL
jgi:hypothetical protein